MSVYMCVHEHMPAYRCGNALYMCVHECVDGSVHVIVCIVCACRDPWELGVKPQASRSSASLGPLARPHH